VIREKPPGNKGGTDWVHKVSGKELNVDVSKPALRRSEKSWKLNRESP
jgi:hypothetical protein